MFIADKTGIFKMNRSGDIDQVITDMNILDITQEKIMRTQRNDLGDSTADGNRSPLNGWNREIGQK